MTAIGVTGHQDIPEAALGFIEDGIQRAIKRFHMDLVGITSLAAGADQLFARIVLQVGGSLRVVIPSEKYETTFSEESARRQFGMLLRSAADVETLPHHSPSETAYLDAGRRIADLSDIVIAIWDGNDAKGKGGTADTVRYARRRGIEVIVIWPSGLSRG